MPWSRTSTATQSPVSRDSTRISEPAGEYLSALSIRLLMTFEISDASTLIGKYSIDGRSAESRRRCRHTVDRDHGAPFDRLVAPARISFKRFCAYSRKPRTYYDSRRRVDWMPLSASSITALVTKPGGISFDASFREVSVAVAICGGAAGLHPARAPREQWVYRWGRTRPPLILRPAPSAPGHVLRDAA